MISIILIPSPNLIANQPFSPDKEIKVGVFLTKSFIKTKLHFYQVGLPIHSSGSVISVQLLT